MVYSLVFAWLDSRPSAFRQSWPLCPALAAPCFRHLTSLFSTTSALFAVIAPNQTSCFQLFAHSFPLHGGRTLKDGWSARSMLRLASQTPCAGDASPACRDYLGEQPQQPTEDSRQGPFLNIERRTSKSDELTHIESYSCIKPPGEGVREL